MDMVLKNCNVGDVEKIVNLFKKRINVKLVYRMRESFTMSRFKRMDIIKRELSTIFLTRSEINQRFLFQKLKHSVRTKYRTFERDIVFLYGEGKIDREVVKGGPDGSYTLIREAKK